jgi:hypothetical protein
MRCTLPVDYSLAVAADGLAHCDRLGVSRLGRGVVIHTAPESPHALPVGLGYADANGQWHRDGRRHTATVAAETASTPRLVVEL